MQRVIGFGGMFFKAKDPKALYAWYEKHLGIKRGPEGGVSFIWREMHEHAKDGRTVWAIFPESTKYFDPSRSSFMMNFVVADLDGLLTALKEDGVEIDPHRDSADYGKFAWIMDPEGNRIELWQPAEGA